LADILRALMLTLLKSLILRWIQISAALNLQ
jgi:hypothetical protein